MRRTIARVLLAALTTAACKGDPAPSAVELATHETTVASRASEDPPPEEAEDDKPNEGDDGEAGGGTGTAMALEEGKLGKREAASGNSGIAGLSGTADFSSGFDDTSLSREQAVDQARHAGVLGTGQYGTIGHGAGTGTGYGYGASSGRGGGSQGWAGTRGRYAPGPDRASSGETYKDYGANAWTIARQDHLSTFAADVDTASYTILRRKLNDGVLPPAAAVRVEELVNYFRYSYPAPAANAPFSVAMELAPSPLTRGHHVLRIGVSTKPLAISERKQANLVFLVDVSGSMQSPDKLELALRSLRVLVDNLQDGDTVALVTYAGSTRVVLPPTGLAHKGKILAAIADLQAGGSTAMGDGIQLAYAQAMQGLRPGAISRVIVLSDGDANVGETGHAAILKTIAGKVKEGVTLSTIGFGTGNYRDELMEQLANKGNGNNFYIDGISAARRVFQEQLGATLEVVAKDVKLQVDFDATRVKRYRLIGYENRDVADRDFRNDKVDAGEIGAGHQVTALYEVELADGHAASTAPIAIARIRHKQPHGTTATEAAFPLADTAIAPAFFLAPAELRFAFAVAAFADVMRGGADAKAWDLAEIRKLAAASAGTHADRKELVALIDRAIALRDRTARIP